MIRRVNQCGQNFYHLNAAKLRQTQTIQKSYISKRQITQPDEYIKKSERNSYQKLLQEMSERLEQIQEKRKQILIIVIEHSIRRPLTKEEKQKIKVL